MSEYLVRWKFGPNSLLNHMPVETHWYKQFHPNKKAAIDHYVSLLQNHTPSSACTAEIFQLIQLTPGDTDPEPEPKTESKPISTKKPTGEEIAARREELIEARNKRIMRKFKSGTSRRDLATQFELSYQQVYAITKKYEEEG